LCVWGIYKRSYRGSRRESRKGSCRGAVERAVERAVEGVVEGAVRGAVKGATTFIGKGSSAVGGRLFKTAGAGAGVANDIKGVDGRNLR